LGYKYGGKTSWNAAHERYLRELVLPHAAHKIVLEEYLQSVSTAGERVARITGQIETLAPQWRLWPAVQAMMMFARLPSPLRHAFPQRTRRTDALCPSGQTDGLFG